MLARLALLFILVPLLELVLLIELGQTVGLWPTIGLVVATGVAGAALARHQGLRTLFAFQEATAGGKIPAQEIQDGLAILVGGAFLLTPGLITDIVGFSLLLPPTRRWIQRRMRKALARQVQTGGIHVTFFGTGGMPGPGAPFGPSRARGFEPEHSATIQEARVIEVESEETAP